MTSENSKITNEEMSREETSAEAVSDGAPGVADAKKGSIPIHSHRSDKIEIRRKKTHLAKSIAQNIPIFPRAELG